MPGISVRDTTLHYDMTGEGPVPLLFVHGMCEGGWAWDEPVERLSNEFTCVTYDRRGHSRSEAGTLDQSYHTHVDDAAALIEALDLDNPVLVGHSAGGRIVVDMMHKHSPLIRAAVLEEPAYFNIDRDAANSFRSAVMPSIDDAVKRGEPRAAVDGVFEIIFQDYWPQLDEHDKNLHRDNAAMMFEAFKHSPTMTTPIEEISGLDVPTLILNGSKSLPVCQTLAGKLTDMLPNARLVEAEGSGHVIHAEQPDLFAQEVAGFVRGLDGTGKT